MLPGRNIAITYVSEEAKAYKREVAWIAKQAGVKPLAGAVEYELELYPPRPQDWIKRVRIDPKWWDMGVRCLDLDNARKVLLDALNGVAWHDDKMVRRDRGEIMVPDGEARVVIRIKPYERAHPQTSLALGEAA